MATYKIEEVE